MQKIHSISLSARLVKNNAGIAAFLVTGMLGIFLTTGIGQDPLQYIHSIPEYRDILLKNPALLRVAIGLDNAFILFYLTMFLALGSVLSKLGKLKTIGKVALVLISTTAILDLVENMHFLTMISSSLNGFEVSENEIKLQVWESLVKFHISYIGFYMLSFVLPETTIKEKLLCFLLRWVQWPVGMLIYIAPIEVAKPLVLVRFAFFFIALLLLVTINLNQLTEKEI